MTVFQATSFVLWIAASGLLCGSALLASVLVVSARRPGPQRPAGEVEPVSVLIPLKKDSPGLGEATRSAFGHGVTVEVVLAATEGSSPAIERATAVAREEEGSWRLLRTKALPGINPKIANLLEPVAEARHERLLLKDAETILPPGHLAAMAACLRPGVGLVVSPPIAIEPSGLGGAVECAVLNTYGARLLLAASTLRIGIGIGAAMMVRRDDLSRADGLAAMAASVADDHALAKAMRRVGLDTVMTAAPVFQAVGRRSLGELWRRHLRWAICRRTEAPLAFAIEPFVGLAATALAASVAAPALGLEPAWAAAATAALWVGIETALAAIAGWPLDQRTPLAILMREAALPVIWVAALASERVRWGDVDVSPHEVVEAGLRGGRKQ